LALALELPGFALSLCGARAPYIVSLRFSPLETVLSRIFISAKKKYLHALPGGPLKRE
jgi:hypothetical protein